MTQRSRVVRFDWIDADIELLMPFGIAGGTHDVARNTFVTVEIEGGFIGLGEAAPFPAFNGETREAVHAALAQTRDEVVGQAFGGWRSIGSLTPPEAARIASARCAVETAMLDAWLQAHRMPMWQFFGGATDALATDCTIPTGTVDEAEASAIRLADAGFRTLKLKVGGASLTHDATRIEAVARTAPHCRLVFDANGGLGSVDDAVHLVQIARAAGATVALFEQPLPADALGGMCEVHERTGVPVAADEGVASVADVVRHAAARAAQVVNLKIMKSGVLGVLDIAAAARTLGIGLMVGGLVETHIAMSTSAAIACGLGGVDFVDLDTPMFLRDAPVEGGYTQRGPLMGLGQIAAGHGARLTNRP